MNGVERHACGSIAFQKIEIFFPGCRSCSNGSRGSLDASMRSFVRRERDLS